MKQHFDIVARNLQACGLFERDRAGLVRDGFSALFAARKGLSEPELLDVLGTNGEPLPHATWAPLFLAAEDGLVTAGGYLRFATDVHRQAVHDRYTPGPPVHAELANYFRRNGGAPFQLIFEQGGVHRARKARIVKPDTKVISRTLALRPRAPRGADFRPSGKYTERRRA